MVNLGRRVVISESDTSASEPRESPRPIRVALARSVQLLPWALLLIVVTSYLASSRSITMAQQDEKRQISFKELEVGALYLTGPRGERRGSFTIGPLGDAELALSGQDGKPRMSLRTSNEGTSSLTLLDGKQEKRVLVMVSPEGTPSVSLCDAKGKSRLILNLGPDGSPISYFVDQTLQPKMTLQVTKDGLPDIRMRGRDHAGSLKLGFTKPDHPYIALHGVNEVLRLMFAIGSEGTLAMMYDQGKGLRSGWSVLDDGSSTFSLHDKNGNGVLVLDVDKDGVPSFFKK